MKKLYAYLMSVLVTASAFAAPVEKVARHADVAKLGTPMTWEEVSLNLNKAENCKVGGSAVAIPAKAASVMVVLAKAGELAAPKSIEDLTTMQWEVSYGNPFSGATYEGVATFDYDEEYDELDLYIPEAPYPLYVGFDETSASIIIYSSVGYGTTTIQGSSYTIKLEPLMLSGNNLTPNKVQFSIPYDETVGGFIFPDDFFWGLTAYSKLNSYAGCIWGGYKFALNQANGDYTLNVSTDEQITADNTWTIDVEKGADVASVKYMVLPENIDLATLAQIGITMDKFGSDLKDNSLTVDPVNNNLLGEPMVESDFAVAHFVAYDAEGNEVRTAQIALPVVIDDEEEGWATVGTTSYVDGVFSQVYTNFTYTNSDVTVQAKTDNSAEYRFVNPYSTCKNYDMAGHTASLGIDATDPSWVMIPFTQTGVNLGGDGPLAFGTWNVLGYTSEGGKSAGVIKENVVTFGANTVLFAEPLYNNCGWYTCSDPITIALPAITIDVTVKDQNDSAVEDAKVMIAGADEEILTDAEGKATLKVPFATGYFGKANIEVDGKAAEVQLNGAANEFSFVKESQTTGIDAVSSTDNEVPEYFNLQGIRVDRPEKGMYIKVQGGKTSKVSIR